MLYEFVAGPLPFGSESDDQYIENVLTFILSFCVHSFILFGHNVVFVTL